MVNGGVIMNHKLKMEKPYLDNLLSGIKKAIIWFNDRDYQQGDTLEIGNAGLPFNPENQYFKITHIHSGMGMRENYVVLSVERL